MKMNQIGAGNISDYIAFAKMDSNSIEFPFDAF